MKLKLINCGIVGLICLIGISCTETHKANDTSQATPAGMQSLFNGHDMDAWQPIGTAIWRIDDGAIVGTQDGDAKRWGLLVTKETFKNFDLTLDFMIDEHGKYNSGVYLRNDAGTGSRTGYQVNIGRGAAEEFCAGIYTDRWLAKGDEKDTIRKKLEWNTMRIIARDAHVIVELNGQRVADYTDPKPEPKFLQEGVIGLQTYGAENHAGWVKFRNIAIKRL